MRLHMYDADPLAIRLEIEAETLEERDLLRRFSEQEVRFGRSVLMATGDVMSIEWFPVEKKGKAGGSR